jgi:hypothetical protein
LNKVIRETLTLLGHQLAQAAIEVRLAFDENLPRIKGNPGKLQQVFLNLFLNARDAMESGGVLAISTSSADGLVKVTVADSGAGIVRENLERIFDPFFTTKMAKKGTGLGLSVSYGIVREHAGDIEVASELGAGTRFSLSFPEAQPTRHEAHPTKHEAQPTPHDAPVHAPELVAAEPIAAPAMSASAVSHAPATHMTASATGSNPIASPSQAPAPSAISGLAGNADRMMR